MKIVILDAYTTNPGDLSWSAFNELGELCVYDRTPPELVLERAAGAQAVITNKTVLNREILSKLDDLKYVGLLSTGYNVVDVDYLKSRNIPVCNVPAYSTNAVAQLVFAFLTHIFNAVSLHNDAVHSGEWVNSRDFCFIKAPLINFEGKTLGIIGFGKIGKAVAKIADAFEMKVLCFVPRAKEHPGYRNFSFVDMDTLLKNSDIVSIHCPLTPETKKMVNEEFISKMKTGAVLINTSRGGVIDEPSLADALKSGKLLAAGVDVLSSEPPKADNPLLACENCIITPHIAWAGFETRERLISIVYDNLKSFSDGTVKNNVW